VELLEDCEHLETLSNTATAAVLQVSRHKWKDLHAFTGPWHVRKRQEMNSQAAVVVTPISRRLCLRGMCSACTRPATLSCVEGPKRVTAAAPCLRLFLSPLPTLKKQAAPADTSVPELMSASTAAAREAAAALHWSWLRGYELQVAAGQEWPGPGERIAGFGVGGFQGWLQGLGLRRVQVSGSGALGRTAATTCACT
jgi:hypothetical protein